MFDIGMTELLVIGIVALIVVGPKDLPGMFRTLGQVTGKMRAMARDFQRAMEDAADDSGVKDIAKDLKGYSNPKKYGLDKLKDATVDMTKWDAEKAPRTKPTPKAEAEAKAPGEADRARPAAPVKDTGTAADTALTAEEMADHEPEDPPEHEPASGEGKA